MAAWKNNRHETKDKELFNAAVKLAKKIRKEGRKENLTWNRTFKALRIHFPSLSERDYNNAYHKAWIA